MTKARQRALEAYPYIGGIKGKICDNSIPIFIQGYEQAVKDILEKITHDIERVEKCIAESVENEQQSEPIYWDGAHSALCALERELLWEDEK